MPANILHLIATLAAVAGLALYFYRHPHIPNEAEIVGVFFLGGFLIWQLCTLSNPA